MNFFDLLGLDPDEPWDQPRFEVALKKKTGEWSRNKVQSAGRKKAEADEAYRLIPTIKEELSDPEKRQAHADRARATRVVIRQRNAQDFDHEVTLKSARGFLLESEAAELARKYVPLLDEQTVGRRLSGIRTTSDVVVRSAIVQPLDLSLASEIERVLSSVGVSTLYEFLLGGAGPLTQKEPRARLLAAADRIYEETTGHLTRSSDAAIRATAAGYARTLFSSDELRARYDATLRETQLRPLVASAGIAAGPVRALSLKQVSLLIDEAARSGIDPDQAPCPTQRPRCGTRMANRVR